MALSIGPCATRAKRSTFSRWRTAIMSRVSRRARDLIAIVGFLTFLSAARAEAAEIVIFFQRGIVGGTVTYDGEGGPLVGRDVPLTRIFDGSLLDCIECLLSFETGPNTVEEELSAEATSFRFSGGGSVELTGTARDTKRTPDPADDVVIATGVLLSGSFDSAANPPFLPFPEPFEALSDVSFLVPFFAAGGYGFDVKHPDLVRFYGIRDSGLRFGLFLEAPGCIPDVSGAFQCELVATSLVNFTVPPPVPEPTAAALLLVGVSGVVRARRRK